MKVRILLVVLGTMAVAVPTLLAQQPEPGQKPPAEKPNQIQDQLRLREQILARQFAEFEQALLKLITRQERSPKEEDRARAKVLREALEKCKTSSISTQFDQIVDNLQKQNLKNLGQVQVLADRTNKLANDIREILALLQADPRLAKARKLQQDLKEDLKVLRDLIHKQKVAEALTRMGKTDKGELGKIQAKITQATAELAKKMGQAGLGRIQKMIEIANARQQQAEIEIAKDNNAGAADREMDAITKLEQVENEIKRRLQQLREEELERLLASLLERCEKMLAMQTQVFTGTGTVFKAITANKDSKPTRADQQQSLKLSDQEKDIVTEATKALELLRAEGSAVAFQEVFDQLQQDMKIVQRRLGVVDPGKVTQSIETDIIDTLKEMIAALKQKQQQMDQAKNPPKDGPPPPKQDPNLLDQIAELKMIRSVQARINSRTNLVGAQVDQTSDPEIARVLRELAERQERIHEVTKRLARRDNK
jgi:hypothetical protein